MFRLVNPPARLPVTIKGLKQYAVVEHDEDDTLLTGLLSVATNKARDITGCVLVDSVWEADFDAFPNQVELLPPLTEVVEVSYLDKEGNRQVLPASGYEVDMSNEAGIVTFKDIPAHLQHKKGSVLIRFRSGWGFDSEDVWQGPQDIAFYIYSCASYVYDNRDADPYAKFAGLLSNYIIFKREQV